ncbi:hypothetical protein [Nocardia vaccinii]|uniref:hypothetical protein n=1 Tax=Nocardia vaccinii TaxID=1822 RepID=UPI0012F5243B|nr:hypothetical protein [Nocardia vaccinii]
MSFPPISAAIGRLSQWGVTVLSEGVPHEPKAGGAARRRFPWEAAWRALLDHPRRSVPR